MPDAVERASAGCGVGGDWVIGGPTVGPDRGSGVTFRGMSSGSSTGGGKASRRGVPGGVRVRGFPKSSGRDGETAANGCGVRIVPA
jgi:hypothetical protein